MPTVIGTLSDFGLQPLAAFQPQVIFTPSGPTTTSTNLLSTAPIIVTPDATGAFSLNLATTDDMRPARWYQISVQWLDAAANLARRDFPDWPLYVPATGGSISDLTGVPSNPAQVWVGLTAPTNPTPGTWWLVDDPANPGTGSGDLLEWS